MAQACASRVEPLFQAFGASEAVALLRCGEFRVGIERKVVGRGEAVRLFQAFAACAGFHAHTENHRLLNDENQHCREEEGGETALRIEERDVLIFQGVRREFVLSVGRVAGALYLDARVHFQRHVGGRSQNGLIIEHTAHVAVDAHARLLHPCQLLGEIFGDVDHTIGFVARHCGLGGFERGGVCGDVHVRRGVEAVQKVARSRIARFVHHDHRYFVHRFRVVDQGVDNGVDDRHDDHEDDQGAVAKYITQRVSECFVHVSDFLGNIGRSLHDVAETSHKE